jgi:hypothetical protein
VLVREQSRWIERNTEIHSCRYFWTTLTGTGVERGEKMNRKDQLAGEIMVMVSSAREQRLRPHEIQKELSTKFSVPLSMVKDVLKELVEGERLVFTYRDPCNYVEIPYTEVNTGARPLKVIVDGDGEPWL